MKINREFLKQFYPGDEGWDNYLKYCSDYSDWEGSLAEFLDLKNISTEYKIWVFTRRVNAWEKMQRKFTIECMFLCETNIEEIRDFQLLIALLYESVNYESIEIEVEYLEYEKLWISYRSNDRASFRDDDWSAYCATDWASDCKTYLASAMTSDCALNRSVNKTEEREKQLKILKWIVRNENKES